MHGAANESFETRFSLPLTPICEYLAAGRDHAVFSEYFPGQCILFQVTL